MDQEIVVGIFIAGVILIPAALITMSQVSLKKWLRNLILAVLSLLIVFPIAYLALFIAVWSSI